MLNKEDLENCFNALAAYRNQFLESCERERKMIKQEDEPLKPAFEVVLDTKLKSIEKTQKNISNAIYAAEFEHC